MSKSKYLELKRDTEALMSKLESFFSELESDEMGLIPVSYMMYDYFSLRRNEETGNLVRIDLYIEKSQVDFIPFCERELFRLLLIYKQTY